MALLVQVRSERANAARGGAVKLSGDQGIDRGVVVLALKALTAEVNGGGLDDLLTVEAADADTVAVAQERVGDVVRGPLLHPATLDMLEWFEFEHLTDQTLRDVSAGFHSLAYGLVNRGDLVGAELTTSLRKLVEAKDCAVRAAIRGKRSS